MAERSKRHHEIPRWLQKEFCDGTDDRLWVGFKVTNEVRYLHVSDVFVRKDGNTRTDYVPAATGGVSREKSDPDEQVLAAFDAETSAFARELVAEARRHRATGQPLNLSWDVVEGCKALMAGQARRTQESQERIGLAQGDEDLYLDVIFQLAEQEGESLPPREEVASAKEFHVLSADLSQNKSANFSSGQHAILLQKESDFLDQCGLYVIVTTLSGEEFVIGSHGITIVEGEWRGSWLPLAPDVAIGLSDKPNTYAGGICPEGFVEAHNRSALAMSERIAGKSKKVIEDLLKSLPAS